MQKKSSNGEYSVAANAKIYKFTITDSEGKIECQDYGTYEQMTKLFFQSMGQIEYRFDQYGTLNDSRTELRPEENYLFVRYYDENGCFIDLEVDDIPMYDEGDDFRESIRDYFKQMYR